MHNACANCFNFYINRYIERQNFLNRTDHRQFEIEKNLRLSNSKR